MKNTMADGTERERVREVETNKETKKQRADWID
jgi:hypothetical protein